MKYKDTKSDRVKTEILRQIQMGNFPRGSQLPSEQEFAVQLNASHMTIRKAIAELEAEKYIYRIPRIGTFVNENVSEKKLQRQLGVILPSWSAPEYNDFMMYISDVARVANWLPRFIFCRYWGDRTFLDAWESCDALICYGPESIRKMPEELRLKLLNGNKPIVFIGVPAHKFGFDAVCGSQGDEMKMVMDYLFRAGHKNIAFTGQKQTGMEQINYQDSTFYSAWQSKMCEIIDEAQVEALDLTVSCEAYHMPHQAIYDKIRAFGAHPQFSAIIVTSSQVTAVMAALKDAGVTIPDSVTVISLGKRQEMTFYRPYPTHLDVSIEEHAKKAFQLVLSRIAEPGHPPMFDRVFPVFVEGETFSPYKNK